MFEKYITIKENKIICGQTSSGVWYCKELPVDSIKDLDCSINQVNKVLNKYNKKEKTPTPKKEKNNVKGLK